MANTYITLSKQIVGVFILLGIFSCGGEKFSSSQTITNNTNQQQDDTIQQQEDFSSLFPVLAKEIPGVKNYISSVVGVKVLIFGVNTGKERFEDLDTRFTDSHIFLNENHDFPPLANRSLTVNFKGLP